jgi:methylmalonyl-CoA mutase N-terminal domain/subunit
MKERFGAENPRSMMMRFHAQTAGVTLTAQQPDNNVVRSGMQALAAILGGAQSLHVNSKDEALALPTEEAVTLSLRTQQVLAHEFGLTDTVDPLAGSYYVEKMTDDLERAAIRYIAHVDELGGAVNAIEEGYQQREIGDAAYKFQLEVEGGQRTIVGVNAYQSAEDPPIATLRIDPEERSRQIARLQQFRANRDGARVQSALEDLTRVAQGTENTMPAILACVEANCTTGEICDVLRAVFGTQRELAAF